jgi:predicted cobalt transporter CbtA
MASGSMQQVNRLIGRYLHHTTGCHGLMLRVLSTIVTVRLCRSNEQFAEASSTALSHPAARTAAAEHKVEAAAADEQQWASPVDGFTTTAWSPSRSEFYQELLKK